LVGAIERTEQFLKKYPRGFVWRADIKKFFNNVDQEKLFNIVASRIKDPVALKLLKETIDSYETREAGQSRERERERERVKTAA